MRLASASRRISAMVSSSERPIGSLSSSMRSCGGMSTSSWSIDSTPIAASISSRSWGEWTRYGILRLARRFGGLLVLRLVHQVLGQVARKLDLQDPALAVRVGVHELGVGGELVVHLGDGAVDGRVEVARRLDRLDHAEGLALRDLAPWLGKLQEHDIAQLGLRKVGDAHGRGLAVDDQPLVCLGVSPLRHAYSPYLSCVAPSPGRREASPPPPALHGRERRPPASVRLEMMGLPPKRARSGGRGRTNGSRS